MKPWQVFLTFSIIQQLGESLCLRCCRMQTESRENGKSDKSGYLIVYQWHWLRSDQLAPEIN